MTKIKGTMGKEDYLLVAQRGNVVLGLKFLCEDVIMPGDQKPRLFVGFRVRSAWADGEGGDFDSDAAIHAGAELVQAWPKITFEKESNARASLSIGFVLNRTRFQMEEVMSSLDEKDFVGHAIAWLVEHAGTEFLAQAPEALKEMIHEEVYAYVMKGISEEPPSDVSIDTKAEHLKKLAQELGLYKESSEDDSEESEDGPYMN